MAVFLVLTYASIRGNMQLDMKTHCLDGIETDSYPSPIRSELVESFRIWWNRNNGYARLLRYLLIGLPIAGAIVGVAALMEIGK